MATTTLPRQLDLSVVQGETKEVLAFVTSSWQITAADLHVRQKAGDTDTLLELDESDGITLSPSGDGVAVAVVVVDSVSTGLAGGGFVYELKVTIGGEPTSMYSGTFRVDKAVVA